ncbi:hypothetical protein F4820DRAFT_405180 [Hypoxylon rubiginosum]|uniref:Uncharacterized protein n=1 Tax=Hypoxylon rubiginosum TaxID=110542 RepID=A0ACB9ZEM0_9PEZI|nr:hypothetical protein F4820DRAFT_405180 [Hypoxylon rubiginosum]
MGAWIMVKSLASFFLLGLFTLGIPKRAFLLCHRVVLLDDIIRRHYLSNMYTYSTITLTSSIYTAVTAHGYEK